MSKQPFTFAILQYRHDVWSGEAMNVGVLLASPGFSYLEFQRGRFLARLTRAFPGLDRVSLRHELEGFERYFLKRNSFPSLLSEDQSAKNFALEALQFDDSSLTWSDFGSGLTGDPVLTHEQLTQRFVTRFASESDSQSRTDPDVFLETKKKLVHAKIYDRMSSHIVSSDVAKVEFPHSIKNGIWHCVQPLSFDLADESNIQDKAAKVAGNMQGLANEVGLQPYFLTGEPQRAGLRPKYLKMLELIRRSPLKPIVIEEADSDELVDHLRDAVG